MMDAALLLISVLCVARNMVLPNRLPAVVAVLGFQAVHRLLISTDDGHVYFGTAVLADVLACVCIYMLGAVSGASSFLMAIMRINILAIAATTFFYGLWYAGVDLESPPLYTAVIMGLWAWQALRMLRVTDDDRRDMAGADAHGLDDLGPIFRVWSAGVAKAKL
jgi:hypothetical protein